MTRKNDAGRGALDRLAEALVEDILDTSDEEILAEFRQLHGDPDQNASAMREAFERTLIATNKKRLSVAKALVAADRANAGNRTQPVDIAEARRRLRHILDTPNPSRPVTLAARKESELSDADVFGMLDDLEELDNQANEGHDD